MHDWRYLLRMFNIFEYDSPGPHATLRTMLGELYGVAPEACFLTASGRAAEYLFLRSLGLAPGSEVLVQSFTCVAAINPILWAGLRPVYVDIDPETLSLSLQSLRTRATATTRVIILQHTLGIPGPAAEVAEFARERGIRLLEDCAHSLGAVAGGERLGVAGDAALLSFGVEKTLRTKTGGALVLLDHALLTRVSQQYGGLAEPPRIETLRWLLYPILVAALRQLPATAREPLGTVLGRAGILKAPLTSAELRGAMPTDARASLPGVLAAAVRDALVDLDANLAHRAAISTLYQELLAGVPGVSRFPLANPGVIKYPLLCHTRSARDHLVGSLQRRGFPVTKWYDPAIFPRGADRAAVRYDPSACPVAEDVAGRILNLPNGNHITRAYAATLCHELVAQAARLKGGA